MKNLIIVFILFIAGNHFVYAQKEKCKKDGGTWDNKTQKCIELLKDDNKKGDLANIKSDGVQEQKAEEEAKKAKTLEEAKKAKAEEEAKKAKTLEEAKKAKALEEAKKAKALEEAKKAKALEEAKKAKAIEEANRAENALQDSLILIPNKIKVGIKELTPTTVSNYTDFKDAKLNENNVFTITNESKSVDVFLFKTKEDGSYESLGKIGKNSSIDVNFQKNNDKDSIQNVKYIISSLENGSTPKDTLHQFTIRFHYPELVKAQTKPGLYGNGSQVDGVKEESNWSQYGIFGGVLLATLAGLFFFIKNKKRKQKTQEVTITDTIQYKGKTGNTFQNQTVASHPTTSATRISDDEKRKIEQETVRNLKAGNIPSHLRNDFDEIKRKVEQEISYKLNLNSTTQLNQKNDEIKKISSVKDTLEKEKQALQKQIEQLNSTTNNLAKDKDNLTVEKLDLQKKLEVAQPYSSEMQTFFNALEYSYAQLKNMANTANKNSRFYPTLSYILQGQSSRSTNAVFDIVKYNDGLMEVLGVNNLNDLKKVNKETFFNRYINNYFERTLTQIAQLNAYATAGASLNTASEIEKDGLGEIKNVFNALNKAIGEFGYQLIEPKLGDDSYNDYKHQKSNNSTLMHIAPEKIESIISGKIYDIARIGFETLSGSTEVKTTVVCKL